MTWLLLLLIGLCDFDKDTYFADDKRIEEELTRTTRLLCEARKCILEGKVPSPELLQWFNEHDALDRRRKNS